MNTRREFLGAMPAGAAAGVLGAGAAVGVLGTQAAAQADEKFSHTRRVTPAANDRPYSRAVAYGPVVWVSGVVGVKPGTGELAGADFESQCKQVMDNLKASVEAAGATMANVLKCTCFLTEFGDFAAFNKIYRTYFPSDPPARSTVVVKELVVAGGKIEVDCVAALA